MERSVSVRRDRNIGPPLEVVHFDRSDWSDRNLSVPFWQTDQLSYFSSVAFHRCRELGKGMQNGNDRFTRSAASLHEPKPNIVTQQCVVYLFKCDLCDAGCVGYTKGHLNKRVEGHRQKASSIYKYYSKGHNTAVPNNFIAHFNVIKKCTTALLMKCCVFKIFNQHWMYSAKVFM